MLEFYAPLRFLHLAAVIASGSLFLLRGALAASGHGALALARPARILSYAIDTVLLAAGVALVVMLPAAFFAGGWLHAKLALLVVYIVLGYLALRSRPGGLRQYALLAAALATFGAIFLVARSHDPLGPLRMLTGG